MGNLHVEIQLYIYNVGLAPAPSCSQAVTAVVECGFEG